MKYQLGFPIDGGSKEFSSVVLVNACRARLHSCRAGKTSGLRPNSGAALVFARIPEEIAQITRFEFIPIPENSQAAPDNIADIGISDAAACALALAQRNSDTSQNQILISCGLEVSEEKQGLHHLRIVNVSEPSAAGLKSLLNKWHVACHHKALALVLHEKDAEILQKSGITCTRLAKYTFQSLPRNTTTLVCCNSQDLVLLAKSLHIPTTLFRISPSLKRKTLLVALWLCLVTTLGLLTVAIDYLQQIHASITRSKQTQTITTSYKPLEKIANHLQEIAEEYYLQGEYQQALKYYFELEAVSQKLGKVIMIAQSHHKIAEVYNIQGNIPQAREHYRKAWEIYQNLAHPQASEISAILQKPPFNKH